MDQAYLKRKSAFVTDLEKQLKSVPPPRQVGFRPFRKGLKAWVWLILGNGILIYLFFQVTPAAVGAWAQDFGKEGMGHVVQYTRDGNRGSLWLKYQTPDSKTHQVHVSAKTDYLQGVAVGASIAFHYFPRLPFWIGLDSDVDLLQITDTLAPFFYLIFFLIYCFWFLSLGNEYFLFRNGEAIKAEIEDFDYGYRRMPTAVVRFTCGGKKHSKKISLSILDGDGWALVLVDPRRTWNCRVYTFSSSAIFEVKIKDSLISD